MARGAIAHPTCAGGAARSGALARRAPDRPLRRGLRSLLRRTLAHRRTRLAGDLCRQLLDALLERLDVACRGHAELLHRPGGALLEDRFEPVPLLAGLGGDV